MLNSLLVPSNPLCRPSFDALFPVVIRNLSLTAGPRRLIDGIDLTLDTTGTTVILGPNGAGKSLLLRLMHGLIAPTGGTVLWAGSPVSDAIRRRQAMVFQKPVLFRRSTIGNITHALWLRGVPRAARVARAIEALRLAGLEHYAYSPARVLSGGEQQRLCLARALSLGPDVVFLDEPTASLDPASTAAIERLLIQMQERGTKLIMVTHDVGQARRVARDIVFLNKGRLEEQQPASTFFLRPKSEAGRAFVRGELAI
jgi:tungstate transport system ATP-binding protein